MSYNYSIFYFVRLLSMGHPMHFHVVLDSDVVSIIDDYRLAARLTSRSDAVTEMIMQSISGAFSKEHRNAVKIVNTLRISASREPS